MIDRSAVARALAKAIAYKMCGKHDEACAAAWAKIEAAYDTFENERDGEA